MSESTKRIVIVLEVDENCPMDQLGAGFNPSVKESYPAPADEWGENPAFPREDWRYEVFGKETNLGYWAWVQHQKETRDE